MARKATSKAKAADTCRLEIIIRGERYGVRPIPPGWHHRAYRLRKADGTAYHVTQGEHGPECDCADCEFRQHACKHIRALAAVGLIDPLPARGREPGEDDDAEGDPSTWPAWTDGVAYTVAR